MSSFSLSIFTLFADVMLQLFWRFITIGNITSIKLSFISIWFLRIWALIASMLSIFSSIRGTLLFGRQDAGAEEWRSPHDDSYGLHCSLHSGVLWQGWLPLGLRTVPWPSSLRVWTSTPDFALSVPLEIVRKDLTDHWLCPFYFALDQTETKIQAAVYQSLSRVKFWAKNGYFTALKLLFLQKIPSSSQITSYILFNCLQETLAKNGRNFID